MANMSENKALYILEHFNEYNREDILAAVKIVSSDPTQSDKLKQFFENYNKVNKVDRPDKEYDKTVMIFRFSDKYKNKYVQGAKLLADKVAEQHETYNKRSFNEMAVYAAVLRSVVSNKKFETALNLLNKAFENKLKGQDVNKAISEEDATAIEYYIASLPDGEKKQELQTYAAQLNTEYDVENGLNSDVEELQRKDNLADRMLSSMNLYDEKGEVSKEFADLAGILNRIEISTENKKGGEKIIDDEDSKRQHIDMLFASAKMEAHMDTISDPDYLTHDSNQQHEILTDRVKEAFLAKIAMAGVASSGEELSFDDLKDEKKVKAWENKRDEEAEKFLQDLLGGKESQDKIKLKTKYLVTSLADTSVEVEKLVSRLGNKFKNAFGNSKSKLQARLNAFEPKARKIYNKAYDIAKAVAKNLKDNKWQHIVNGVATVGMHAAIMVGGISVAPWAIAGYALYSVGGNYVWPVVAERRRLKEEAAKNNQKLGFRESFAQAWNIKKNDKVYKARRRWGWLGGTIGAAAGLVGISQLGLSAVGAKVVSGIGRSISGLSAQGMTELYAKQDYMNNPSEANKAKLRNARISTGISALGTIFAVLWGSGRINNDLTNAATDSVNDAATKGGLLDKVKNIFKGRPAENTDSISSVDTTGNAGEPEVVPEDLGFGGPKIPVDVDAFNADEKSMFLHSLKHFDGGKEKVEMFYDAFRNGMVESLPDGMSPAQYVDALSRLQEFSAHPEAVEYMWLELNCPEKFNLSKMPVEEATRIKKTIADALKDISYEHGKMKVAIMNDCGELEIKEVSRWGQYIGKQKMVEAVVDGHKELIPLRNANRSFGIGAVVDCADGKVTIHGRVKYGSLPCDKQLVEITPPAPKKVTPPVEVIPEIDCDDIPNAGMAENTTGYQTSGQYTSPINVNVNRNTGHYLVDGDSVAANELMQKARQEFASAGMTEESNLGKLPGVLRATKDKVIIYLDEGSITPAGKDIPVSCNNGQPVEFEMKRDDYLAYLETGEMPSRTKSVPLTDENYQNILYDEQFAYKGDKGDRSNFTTSVAGAEYFSMPKPVDFSGDVSQLGIEQGGKIASVTMSTSSGPVDVFVNTETGDITAKLGDKPVRFSPETQEKAAAALAERLSSRYDVADLSLAAPEGTLAKKAEMAMQGQSYVPSREQLAQNVHATGSANIRPLWQAHQGQLRA